MKTYHCARRLTPRQEQTLTLLIGWRRGSSILVRESDQAVVGCVADPTDFQDVLARHPVRYTEEDHRC
jgi:hypothetical protein